MLPAPAQREHGRRADAEGHGDQQPLHVERVAPQMHAAIRARPDAVAAARARLEADRREIVEIESAIQGGNHGCDLQGAHASGLPARGLVR